jgi:hypothetical protein
MPRDADGEEPRLMPRDEDGGGSVGTISPWATGVTGGRVGMTSAGGPQQSLGYAEQPPRTPSSI